MIVQKFIIFLSLLFYAEAFFFLHKLLKLMDPNVNRYIDGDYQYQNSYNPAAEEYDFIIVGAGPSGCVLANRLSQNPNWKILLLEAGKPENVFSEIPVLTTYKQSTDYSWKYLSEPQNTSCWGMVDYQCALPKGKGLGGSTLINYMTYIRGNKQNFDDWAALGNSGWSYDEVLPYFLRSERSTLQGYENSSYHNQFGSLNVEYPPYRTQIARSFVKGSRQLGYKKLDYNGESQLGVSYLQANTVNGQRHSAYRAFIEPVARYRSNLRIKSYSRATKVLIDQQTKEAYGVEYVTNKIKYVARARKEVILSAGVFNSAQLLMLSGVGPQEHLKEINVPLVQNLPVGETLFDHIKFPGPTFILNSTGQSINYDRLSNLNTLSDYYEGQGPLTIPGGIEALSFMQTSYSQQNRPDVGMLFSTASFSSDLYGLKTAMRIRDDIYNFVYRPLEYVGNDQWTSYIILLNPASKGYMKLKDNNPFHWPKIYTNYLTEEEDVQKIMEGIKEAIRISKSEAMEQYGIRIHRIPLPNCEKHDFGTDIYWECAIRTLSGSLHHQSGTCKMGPESDSSAVVSSNLTVHGVKNLRVVDESVIPIPTSGDTATIAYMIGEKAADLIKGTYTK